MLHPKTPKSSKFNASLAVFSNDFKFWASVLRPVGDLETAGAPANRTWRSEIEPDNGLRSGTYLVDHLFRLSFIHYV